MGYNFSDCSRNVFVIWVACCPQSVVHCFHGVEINQLLRGLTPPQEHALHLITAFFRLPTQSSWQSSQTICCDVALDKIWCLISQRRSNAMPCIPYSSLFSANDGSILSARSDSFPHFMLNLLLGRVNSAT